MVVGEKKDARVIGRGAVVQTRADIRINLHSDTHILASEQNNNKKHLFPLFLLLNYFFNFKKCSTISGLFYFGTSRS